MFDSLEIIKENSHEEVSLKLHELIAEFLKDNKEFNLGLSGGSTPKFFYQTFAESFKENNEISFIPRNFCFFPLWSKHSISRGWTVN